MQPWLVYSLLHHSLFLQSLHAHSIWATPLLPLCYFFFHRRYEFPFSLSHLLWERGIPRDDYSLAPSDGIQHPHKGLRRVTNVWIYLLLYRNLLILLKRYWKSDWKLSFRERWLIPCQQENDSMVTQQALEIISYKLSEETACSGYVKAPLSISASLSFGVHAVSM